MPFGRFGWARLQLTSWGDNRRVGDLDPTGSLGLGKLRSGLRGLGSWESGSRSCGLHGRQHLPLSKEDADLMVLLSGSSSWVLTIKAPHKGMAMADSGWELGAGVG